MQLTLQDVRPEVVAFAIAMEEKLRKHDDRGGWDDCHVSYLCDRAMEELQELHVALEPFIAEGGGYGYPAPYNVRESILDETVDVANFCMMIADLSKSLE